MALLAPVTAKRALIETPVTASAVRIQRVGPTTPDPATKRTRMAWQERAFAYYELLGEIWYAAQFYARALQKLELRLVRIEDDGELVDVEAGDPLLDYLTRIQDPGGGRSNLMGSYGRLKFLAGECYLLVTTDADGVETWEMLSCDELRWDANSSRYLRYRMPNTQPETLDETPEGEWEPVEGEAIAYRFWTRHPRYSNLPDAPMRGVLDLCEELVILTRAVRARGRSRLSGAGLLLVPTELSFASDNASDPDEDPSKNQFLSRLTEHMVAGLADEGSASAVVPMVVEAQAELIEKLRHMTFFDPAQVYPETGLRMECIQRIAIGIDMPPEILLGKAGANHWSAWQIDEDSWKAHLQPVAQSLVDDLTGGYLRPSMRGDNVEGWESYAIAYDASAIIQHPDRAKDAKDLWDRGGISYESLRDATGFDDEDAMDEAEFAQWVGIKLGDAGLAVTGEVTAPVAPAAAPPPGAGDATPDVEKAPPENDPGNEDAEEPEAEVASAVPPPVLLASELISERAREIAGARVRNRYRADRRVRRVIDGIDNRDVCAVVGPHLNGDLDELLADRHNLVAGAGDCFRYRLASWGLSDGDVEMVIATAEQHAAETLFDAVHA